MVRVLAYKIRSLIIFEGVISCIGWWVPKFFESLEATARNHVYDYKQQVSQANNISELTR